MLNTSSITWTFSQLGELLVLFVLPLSLRKLEIRRAKNARCASARWRNVFKRYRRCRFEIVRYLPISSSRATIDLILTETVLNPIIYYSLSSRRRLLNALFDLLLLSARNPRAVQSISPPRPDSSSILREDIIVWLARVPFVKKRRCFDSLVGSRKSKFVFGRRRRRVAICLSARQRWT